MGRSAARLLLAALSVLMMVAAAGAQAPAADQDQIKHLMRKTWERPDAPLSIDPVVVVEDHAIAGWVQDGRGGRALLRRAHGTWDVVLCSGDQLRSPETITATGASPDLARRLVVGLLAAEAGLPPDRLAKLASFEGIVPMGSAHQPHGHK